MAEGIGNLIGGLAQGFVGSKQQAKQLAMMEEYRKAQSEHIKLEAKKAENALKLQEFEAPIYQAMAAALQGQGQPGAAAPAAPTGGGQPFAQFMPQQAQPRAAQPQPIPDMVAQGQMPFLNATPAFGRLQPDLANRAASMAQEFYQTTGQPLKVTDAYRSFEQQADVHRRKPGLALPPGTSNHEKGLAIDIDPMQADILSKTGLLQKYGFTQPALSKGETYHLELGNVGGGMGTPQQAMQPQPQQAQPMRQPLITGEKLLQGFLKKKFGVEPDDAKVVPYGDHKLVTNKQGTPLFLIAGQGKMEMVDIKQPDGSVVRTPQLIPPSPLPGGIPVYNMAGQPAGGMAGPGGIQTTPPEYSYEEVSAPGGGKQKIPIPKAQAGGMAIPTEPPGIKVGDVGKTNLILHANDRLKEVNELLFPGGKVDRGLLFKATAPMGGIGEGAKFYSKMYQTIDAALRLETGAQATPGEIQVKMREFWPNPQDTESVIREKNRDLNRYLTGLKQLHDPTGKISESKGVSVQIPSKLSNQKPKTWEELKQQLTGGQ